MACGDGLRRGGEGVLEFKENGGWDWGGDDDDVDDEMTD